MKILHVVPDSATLPNLNYLGSTKDIMGRPEYFKMKSLEFDQVITPRSDVQLFETLSSMSLKEYSVFFIELPKYPEAIRYIRFVNPKAKIFTRSINAELHHRWHSFISALKAERDNNSDISIVEATRIHLPLLEILLKEYSNDRRCAKLSDAILSITDWETRHYWRRLTGGHVATVPYYLPEEYVREIQSVHAEKENICVSFMGVFKIERGSFLADSLDNFTRLVRELKDEMPDWSFKVTGELSDESFTFPTRIEPTGFIKSPYPLLARSRAVAILSPYGMGFKTKILEAILAGCYVLIPLQLMKRQPEAIKPYCIEVDLKSVSSFKRALQRCLEPFPIGDPNTLLKQEAFNALDKLFDI